MAAAKEAAAATKGAAVGKATAKTAMGEATAMTRQEAMGECKELIQHIRQIDAAAVATNKAASATTNTLSQ